MDYYTVLGLKAGATKEEIKRAYRRLAMQWHPDRNPSPEARSKFILLTEAYDALMSGKRFSGFTKTTAHRAPQQHAQPKTREDLRREKMMGLYEQYNRKFRNIRQKYNDPATAPESKESMYRKINFMFGVAGAVLLAFILVPVIAGAYAGLIVSLPLGFGFSLRIFWNTGRKKYRADMIFGEEENYSLEELKDFFAQNPDIGVQPWGGGTRRW